MTKRRLGKGLGALFPEGENFVPLETDDREAGAEELLLEKIIANPNQPRKDFDEEKLREMAQTMLKFGVIQPVIVQKKGDSYVLVAGERRWRAAGLAGLKTIPAIVRDYPPEQLTVVALIENLQRQDLNPIEEANAYQILLQEHGLTQEELAGRLGISRSAIANGLRLLSLDPFVQSHIAKGILSAGQARPLLALAERELQRKFAAEIVNRQLNVRQVEKMVQSLKKKNEAPVKDEKEEAGLGELLLKELEERLHRLYGTKVVIRKYGQEGRVEVFYYSEEDLERLISIMLGDVGNER
ncbi:MAG TPA: chromosome partitioning protein ParB [Firmicutes bacterium]|nr:chromosome partitioning protein ParB [Bacillota bacterium]